MSTIIEKQKKIIIKKKTIFNAWKQVLTLLLDIKIHANFMKSNLALIICSLKNV